MPIIDSQIIEFIHQHHVLTLATSFENKPYCANCFYVYIPDDNVFVFTSDEDTKHITDAISQPYIAGSIVLETDVIGKIQGIQFNGYVKKAEGDEGKKAKRAYLKKYPFAVLMKTTLWILEPTFVKMTDNRLGFGKKLIWKKSDETKII